MVLSVEKADVYGWTALIGCTEEETRLTKRWKQTEPESQKRKNWVRFAVLNVTEYDFSHFGLANIEAMDQVNRGGIGTFNGDMSAFRNRRHAVPRSKFATVPQLNSHCVSTFSH
ncbi:hypothetical protein B0H13DRAFT_2288018 [Mycena leptocephala]|nr:hypothetical protein B0H13DRAFT_2288018 [Mycena leptocephala]